jgi:hypothetical protein
MLKQLDLLIGFAVVMSLVSMLIMVINQMFMSGLQMRGKQLMDALEAMFKTLDPNLADKAKALAEAVLRHPIISDSAKSGEKRGLASAIRPEELLGVLKKLRDGAGALRQCGFKALKHADGAAKMSDIAEAAGTVLGILEQPKQAIAQATSQLAPVVNALPNGPALMEHVHTLEEGAKINVQSTLQQVEKWFGTAEDRAREWFATRAQQANSIIAVVLVLLLQLDVFQLFRQLQTDDVFRAALVSSAASVEAQAKTLSDKAKNATTAADSAAAAQNFDSWKKEAADIQKKATETGFQLIPAHYPRTIWEWSGWAARSPADGAPGSSPTSIFSLSGLRPNVLHFFGMAFFAALLSLGAPYWFNLLKTLTSFRPLLAQQVEKDRPKKKS